MATRNLCVALAILLIGGLSPAWAGLVEVSYLETELGGGFYEYDFIVSNKSVPKYGLGVWYVELGLGSFEAQKYIEMMRLPDGWAYFASPETPQTESTLGYISLFSGAEGTDIAPGDFLEGFLFKTDLRLEAITFYAQLNTYKFDEFNYPILRISEGDATPVSEPATLILFTAGLAGMSYYRRRMLSL